MTTPETTLVAIDGRDALFFLIARPGTDSTGVVLEHGGNGITQAQAAYILRKVADSLDALDADA